MLQDESQQVAFGGQSASDNKVAIEKLAQLAAARGAKVGVDLTWAWLDNHNSAFPSYSDMQVLLSPLCVRGCAITSRQMSTAALTAAASSVAPVLLCQFKRCAHF